ncbi:gliding motility-associated C-terminal domain-containing protein [Membranihabitans maritimus]|uniref:T9SS type B sorting domain-containing protein n=1 Tax=Membranihabitans maritimus TaxID=2904244 RepID=UPI001F169A4D|nr:gliding motility-associated C-terminal domain-containing protein [Membranihabitans maritimus]
MNRFFISFLSILFISSGNQLVAQSEINFVCFTVDSISWEFNINNCATNDIENYEIYTRETSSENFSVAFAGPGQTSTAWKSDILKSHDALFITYNMNCPAEMSVTSDTLSLESLRTSVRFENIEVQEDGSVYLKWERKPIDGVQYNVNSIVNGNSEVIATDLTENEFTDTRNLANTESIFYSITAFKDDDCKYTFPEPDEGYSYTPFLSGKLIECEGRVSLDFEPSNYWFDDMDSRTLFISENGNLFDSISLGLDTDSIEYTNISPGNVYRFYVEEKSSENTRQLARSNTVIINADFFDAVQWIAIREISFDPNNNLSIEWQTDPTDEPPEYTLIQGASESMTNPLMVNEFGTNQYSYELDQFDPDNNHYSLSIEDSCENIVTSLSKEALWVSAQLLGGYDLAMEWNVLGDEELTIDQYDVYLVENGSSSLLSSVRNFSGQFIHNFSENNPKDSACVYVIAKGTLEHSEWDESNEVEYRSNTVCVYGETKIILPNALAPGSGNDYLPIISPREGIVEFEMTIYDRYGNIIFQSNNPNVGWNGSTNGANNTIDIYAAVVKVTNQNGEVFSETQSVVLLR